MAPININKVNFTRTNKKILFGMAMQNMWNSCSSAVHNNENANNKDEKRQRNRGKRQVKTSEYGQK